LPEHFSHIPADKWTDQNIISSETYGSGGCCLFLLMLKPKA